MTLVNAEGVRHRHSYYLDADHEFRDRAKAIADQCFDIMIEEMVNQPRSLQKRIGPSEMGIPCSRAILHKLARVPEPPRGPAWKPQVGTALHDQQERWFTKAAAKGASEENRWMCEQSVVVGQISGEDHAGSTDLFDGWGHAVGDWKFVGPSRLKHYRAKGPSASSTGRRRTCTGGLGFGGLAGRPRDDLLHPQGRRTIRLLRLVRALRPVRRTGRPGEDEPARRAPESRRPRTGSQPLPLLR
jgi:hypothetical protein